MSTRSAIDLSLLAAPVFIEQKDFETIVAEMLADIAERMPTLEISESDPAYKIIEVLAYREMNLRAETQDAGEQNMLAYATWANLDQIGANFDCVRKTNETDEEYRLRIPLSLEAISTAGPTNAYIYHALSVDGVEDASATSPDPGEVLVSIIAEATDENPQGTPDSYLIAAVTAALNDEDVRPLTDSVTVQASETVEYSIAATLYFLPGPDAETVMDAAAEALDAYIASCRKIGTIVARSGIDKALHQTGVSHVEITLPAANVSPSDTQIAFCTGITLTNGGIDE